MSRPHPQLTLAGGTEPGPVRVALCGGLRIEVAGERCEDRAGGLPGLLIAYLALNRGRPVPREELIERLWEGPAPGAPRAALNVHLSRARRALGDGLLTHRDGALGLAPGLEVDVDAALDAAEEARRTLD